MFLNISKHVMVFSCFFMKIYIQQINTFKTAENTLETTSNHPANQITLANIQQRATKHSRNTVVTT